MVHVTEGRLLTTSDVSIYKSDFNIDLDYFHVNKFDSDFFDIRMRCYSTWFFHLINLVTHTHIFRQPSTLLAAVHVIVRR
jgi:hypothetical protein